MARSCSKIVSRARRFRKDKLCAHVDDVTRKNGTCGEADPARDRELIEAAIKEGKVTVHPVKRKKKPDMRKRPHGY